MSRSSTDNLLDQPGPQGEAFRRLTRLLRAGDVGHVFVGDVAIWAYGPRPAITRFEASVPHVDLERFYRDLAGSDIQPIGGRRRHFVDAPTQTAIDLHAAGEVAGDRFRQSSIHFPQPDEAVWQGGLPVPPLPRVIELLLAMSGLEAALDIVALKHRCGFDQHLQAELDPVVRPAFEEALAQEKYL